MARFLEQLDRLSKNLTFLKIGTRLGVRKVFETGLRRQFTEKLPELGKAADEINWSFLTCLGAGNNGILIVNQLSPTPVKRIRLDLILRTFRANGLGQVDHEVTQGWADEPILVSRYNRSDTFSEDHYLGSWLRINDKRPLSIFLHDIGQFVFVDEPITPETLYQLEDGFDLQEIHADNKGRFFFKGDQKYGLKYQRIVQFSFPWSGKNLLMYAKTGKDTFNIRAPQRLRRLIPVHNAVD